MSPLFGGGSRRDEGASEASRERTAEEREAARLERERRRAEREGRAVPEAPAPAPIPADPVFEPEAPAPAPIAASEPSRDDSTATVDAESSLDAQAEAPVASHEPVVEEPQWTEPEPVAVAPAPEPVAHAPEPVAHEPHPTQAFEAPPTPDEASRDDSRRYSQGESSLDAPGGEEGTREEAPVGVKRVGAPSVRDLPQVAPPQPHERPKPRGLPRQRRGAKRLLLLVPLLILAGLAYGYYRYAQPGHGEGTGQVRVTIPPGSSAGDVADLLAEKGVIDSAFFLNLHARLEGKREDIKAGTFTLQRDMSYSDALAAITSNPVAPKVLRVTFPEGRSIREAAPLVKQAGFRGSYVKAATRSPRSVAALKGYNVPKGTTSLEGFLFPAGYELKRKSTARQLVDEQVAQFRKQLATVDLRKAKRKNLTSYDVLIIASMIEREVRVDKERRLIAAVIYNRLQQSIPLGIDATLRYALNNWSRPLRVSELQRDSPFNTRTRQGLPPTPIGSPGLASLKAAADPANVDYLYYVVKPCGNGTHAFSSTDAQFQRDVAAYNKKRDELGGKDPSDC